MNKFSIAALFFFSGICGMQSDAELKTNATEQLFQAIKANDSSQIAAALACELDLYQRDGMGKTLLICAAEKGLVDVCLALIDKGADVLEPDMDEQCGGYTAPLGWAVINGHTNVCQALISKHAAVHQKNFHGETPLTMAAGRWQFELAQFLLKHLCIYPSMFNKSIVHKKASRTLLAVLCSLQRCGIPRNIGHYLLSLSSALRTDLGFVLCVTYLDGRLAKIPNTLQIFLREFLTAQTLDELPTVMDYTKNNLKTNDAKALFDNEQTAFYANAIRENISLKFR